MYMSNESNRLVSAQPIIFRRGLKVTVTKQHIQLTRGLQGETSLFQRFRVDTLNS